MKVPHCPNKEVDLLEKGNGTEVIKDWEGQGEDGKATGQDREEEFVLILYHSRAIAR